MALPESDQPAGKRMGDKSGKLLHVSRLEMVSTQCQSKTSR
jgi:hypothetical protein